jgi:hypothetical protein
MNHSSSAATNASDIGPKRTAAIPGEINLDPGAWWTATETQADVLVMGDALAVSRILNFFWPTVRKPVFWCDRRLAVPDHAVRTLLLQDLDETWLEDQDRFLFWLEAKTSAPPRLIATAGRPLLDDVESGRFRRNLYGRFQAVQLIVSQPASNRDLRV